MAITVSGTTITFNDATTQTTAAVAGVTSLNGQTGAITNTTLGNIGSVVFGAYTSTTNLTAGTTAAGSSIYYVSTILSTDSNWGLITNGSAGIGTFWNQYFGGRRTSGNTGFQLPLGMTALSGTWRVMQGIEGATSGFAVCCNVTTSYYKGQVFMRVS
jgi:hypothetical protein